MNLEKLKEIMSMTTPGPWTNSTSYIDGETILADSVSFVADDVKRIGDAIFIVAARNAMPLMIDEIEKLTGECQRLREENKQLRVTVGTVRGLAYEDGYQDARKIP